MMRRRQGRRRRRRGPCSSAASLTLAFLALYTTPLSFSRSPSSAVAAAAAAATRPPGVHQQERQFLHPTSSGGGIGGKGQQGPTIDIIWTDINEEELVSERKKAREGRGVSGDQHPRHTNKDDDELPDRARPASRGGSKNDGERNNDDRWAAQSVGVPAPSQGSSCHGSHSPSDGFVVSSPTVKTIGGTVPDILEDSAWCVGDDDYVPLPTAKAGEGLGGGKEQSCVVGGVGDSAEGTGSGVAAADAAVVDISEIEGSNLSGSTVDDGDGEEAAAGKWESSIGGVAEVLLDGEVRRSSSGQVPEGDEGRSGGGTMTATTTIASSSIDLTAADATNNPERDGDHLSAEAATPVYPFSRGPSTDQSFPTAARSPVASERPSRQMRRGPLVKGQGENTNTRNAGTDDTEHRGAGDLSSGKNDVPDHEDGTPDHEDGTRMEEPGRRHERPSTGSTGNEKGWLGRDLSTETREGGGDEKEGEEEILEAAVAGKGLSSWRSFACVLLLCAALFGTYLRGSWPHWLPSFSGDGRKGWSLDLDAAIAHARSRTGSFCSGRASAFSGDPVDDAVIPELISDHDDDEEDDGSNDGNSEHVPLMWDTRPKPDDYLIFHPVLGVVPAGVVRAWGGDGCGGWSGVGRGGGMRRVNGATTALAAGVASGGAIGKDESCSLSSSPRSSLAEVSSKADAVGGASGRQLPPEEWAKWLAAREAAVAAAEEGARQATEAAVAAKAGDVARKSAATVVPAENTTTVAPAAATIVPEEVLVEDRTAGSGGDTERSGDNQRAATMTTKMTEALPVVAGAGTVAVGAGKVLGINQQSRPNSCCTTPAAISLQFEDGCGSVNGSSGDSSGSDSTEGGLVRPLGVGGADGDIGLTFGVVDGGGSVGSCCSSEDNNRDLRTLDFSAGRVPLSSEQPPPVAVAFHVS